jgi:hypothetical protein
MPERTASFDKDDRSDKASSGPYDEKDVEAQVNALHHVRSHMSTHDAIPPDDKHYETGDEIYNKFSPSRKIVIVLVLCVCSFLAPISSTSIVAASPEVVATYNTTGTIFNLSNALYLLFMGLSPLFWGPIGQTYGRRWTLIWSGITFTAFSIGTALAPNLASYFIFRMLTAFQGTS